METNVTVNLETAAKAVVYMLGSGIMGMITLKSKGMMPAGDSGMREFTGTLVKYLTDITGKEDIEVIVNNDYFMSIHIEDYEYSFMINNKGEMKEIVSTGDIFLEQIRK